MRTLLALLLLTFGLQAATEYHHVRGDAGVGSVNGENWDNAWGLTHLLQAGKYSANVSDDGLIGPGDIVYIAGADGNGTSYVYTNTIRPQINATSSNPIILRRATVSEHGSGTGWDNDMDKQIDHNKQSLTLEHLFTLLRYKFDTTTSAGPASGYVRFNSATYSSVTTVWVNDTDQNSNDNDLGFDTTDDVPMRIQLVSDTGTKVVYNVTAVADSGSYHTFTVTHSSGSGTFSNGADIDVRAPNKHTALHASGHYSNVHYGRNWSGAAKGSHWWFDGATQNGWRMRYPMAGYDQVGKCLFCDDTQDPSSSAYRSRLDTIPCGESSIFLLGDISVDGYGLDNLKFTYIRFEGPTAYDSYNNCRPDLGTAAEGDLYTQKALVRGPAASGNIRMRVKTWGAGADWLVDGMTVSNCEFSGGASCMTGVKIRNLLFERNDCHTWGNQFPDCDTASFYVTAPFGTAGGWQPCSTYSRSYTFSTTTTAPPDSGGVRYNHATPSSVTTVWVHDTDAGAGNNDTILDPLINSRLIVELASNPTTRAEYRVTAATDSGAYHTFTVEYDTGSGSFGNGVSVNVVVNNLTSSTDYDAAHSEMISMRNSVGAVFRYNYFHHWWNNVGGIGFYNNDDNGIVTGNVFAQGRGKAFVFVGDEEASLTDGAYFYNNTLYELRYPWSINDDSFVESVYYANNILIVEEALITYTGFTHDFNYWEANVAGSYDVDAEPNGVTGASASALFSGTMPTSSTHGSFNAFRLKVPTTALRGTQNLYTGWPSEMNSNPYRIDPDGIDRSSDDFWDVGAFTYGGTAPDTTPPIISGKTVANITTTSCDVSFQTDEPATSYVKVGLNNPPTTWTFSNGSFVLNRTIPVTGLASGTTYNYQCFATDDDGNLRTDSVVLNGITTLTSDVTPPSTSVTAPSPGTISGSVTFSASASDNIGVTLVEFRVDGGKVGEDATAPYSIPWDTRGTTDGSHTLTSKAYDAAGNSTVSSGVAVTVDNPSSLTEGLVLYFKFNETSGDVVDDATANANDGAKSGGTWATGKFNNGLQFDGIDDILTVPHSTSLNISSAITLAMWVYLEDNGSYQQIVNKVYSETEHITPYTAYGFLLRDSGTTYFPRLRVTISGAVKTLEDDVAITFGTWKHWVGTYDGTTMRLYIDGSEVANSAQTGAIDTNANDLFVARNGGGFDFVKGIMDELRVYNRALSAAEVQELNAYDATEGGPTPPAPPALIRARAGRSSSTSANPVVQ